VLVQHGESAAMKEFMHHSSRIFVAGHRGLVGSAILRNLKANGYTNLLLRSRTELDLLDQKAVRGFFAAEKPEFVFLAAAKVGGIVANNTYPADFIAQNLAIQSNIIEAAYQSHVKRLLFLGSSCIYPKMAPQPIKEEYLLTGPLEPTNRAYALAKIAGIEMCWSFNRQYGTNYLAAMPTNLYGPGDNYDLTNSHVIPALLRKVAEAKEAGRDEVVVWGTGNVRREFLYSDDLAEGCVYLMNLDEERFQPVVRSQEQPPLINIGTGEDVTIRELAQLICDVLEYRGRLTFDTTKPDGTPRKVMDVSRMHALGWRAKTDLTAGLRRAYADFKAHEAEYVTA
jgi:GDP-L-fucose synthase